MTEEFAHLYGLSSKGTIKTWKVTVVDLGDGITAIDQEYGALGGKLTTNRKTVREGKNIGKNNETTPHEQAVLEARSKWEKKCSQEGYSIDKDNLRIPRLPMLAKNYEDHKNKVTFPVYCQSKLDGLRCLAEKIDDKTIRYTSRKGLEFKTLDHITPSLLEVMNVGEVFDGELFCKDLTFQEITAAVKKKRDNTLKLELWIYDLADEKLDFVDRYKRYSSIDDKPGIIIVESYRADSEDDIYKSHDEFVARGYEGLILRAVKGGYDFKKRSDKLLKLKSFNDSEYMVIGGYEGSGSAEGHATLICVTESGQKFGCVMRGSHSYRASLWRNLDKIVAAQAFITVKYFGVTDGGLPRFPVGICFRDGGINKNGVFEPNF